jgi:cyclic dehypoxanthinyl futalosine synthase
VLADAPQRVELRFGDGESPDQRAAALHALRDRAAVVRAVTLVAAPPASGAVGEHNNTAVQWLRLTALTRLTLPGSVHVEGSWRRHGRGLGQVVLHAGADDFGAVLSQDQEAEMVDGVWPMTVREAERNLRLAGFSPVVRTGGYERRGAAQTAAEPKGRPMRRLTPMATAK